MQKNEKKTSSIDLRRAEALRSNLQKRKEQIKRRENSLKDKNMDQNSSKLLDSYTMEEYKE